MPEFKDISTFNQVTPVGTERIQVSAANCVTLWILLILVVKLIGILN